MQLVYVESKTWSKGTCLKTETDSQMLREQIAGCHWGGDREEGLAVWDWI